MCLPILGHRLERLCFLEAGSSSSNFCLKVRVVLADVQFAKTMRVCFDVSHQASCCILCPTELFSRPCFRSLQSFIYVLHCTSGELQLRLGICYTGSFHQAWSAVKGNHSTQVKEAQACAAKQRKVSDIVSFLAFPRSAPEIQFPWCFERFCFTKSRTTSKATFFKSTDKTKGKQLVKSCSNLSNVTRRYHPTPPHPTQDVAWPSQVGSTRTWRQRNTTLSSHPTPPHPRLK